MSEIGAIPSEKYHCRWTLLCRTTPKWIFHNLGNLLQPLEVVPESRKHLVQQNDNSEQFLETANPGQGFFKPKRHSIANMRQSVTSWTSLICLQEEAALATNWIKDRSEGLKIQNLGLATMTGPAMSNFTENFNCRCPTRY